MLSRGKMGEPNESPITEDELKSITPKQLMQLLTRLSLGAIGLLMGLIIAVFGFGYGVGIHSLDKGPEVEEWLSSNDAVEKLVPSKVRLFVPPEVQKWHNDHPNYPETNTASEYTHTQIIKYLQQQLHTGKLIARGTPHYATAGEDNKPIVINSAQWESLSIAGQDFSDAPSRQGPSHAYDNLEIGKPKARGL
jgi:hypothetical protein